MKIIYILGTDGAGKTTLAKRLARERLGRQDWQYLYCQVTPFFIWALKAPANVMFMRKTNQFKDYDEYAERKGRVSGRMRGLVRLYAWAWYLDFLSQTVPKIVRAKLTGKNLIIDRFYLDAVVNQGVLQKNDIHGMTADAHRLEQFLPHATLHIFLSVSETVAFSRKDDIQSVRFLTERKQRYLELAPHYNFQIIDADASEDEVFEAASAMIEEHLSQSTDEVRGRTL